MFRKISLLLTIVALAAAFATAAFGQTTAGAVVGNVLDPNGAVVPNATVTLRNKATGQVLSTQTSGAGSYNFPNVPSGDYTVTVESSGFQQSTAEVTSVLNQTSTADVTLGSVGGAVTTVDVTAASEALVQTDTSQLGKTFSPRQVTDLPIFGNQNALALLSPNVVGQSSGTAGSGGSVGGTRARFNSFNIDGVDNNDPSVTGPQVSVIQDAVQDFTILTNNYNAEFGFGSGGQFNTITKTGTNEFHGNGFLYTQNNRLNAASTSEESAIRTGQINRIPRFRDTRYGATVGGPIVKNKLFFFGAFQREPNSAEGSASTFSAPTAAGLAQIAGLPGASPFVVNLLRNNLTLAPSANTTLNVLGTPIPFGDVTTIIPQGFDDNQFQINIDQLRGTKDQFRYRFSFDRFNAVQPGSGNTTFNNLLTFNTRLFSATYVRTFNSSVVNEVRGSYRRVIQDFPLVNPAFNNFPNITEDTTNLSLGPNSNLPQGSFNNSYQLFDTVSLIRGRNNFRLGGEVRKLITTSFFLPRARGDYEYATFDELISDQAPTSTNLRGVGSAAFTGNNYSYAAFGQDDLKVTPNLTLNLGVRYEYATLPRDAAIQSRNSIANVPGVISFGIPKTDKNNFAPRVGFAYSPGYKDGILGRIFGERGKSSIRGNFSVAYSPIFQNLILLELPPQFQQELNSTNAAGQFNPNAFLQNGGLPSTPIPPTTTAAARNGTGSFIVDQIAPYTESYTLSIQRELNSSTAIEVRYLGTQSHKQPVQFRFNGGRVDPSQLTIPTFFSAPSAAQLAGLPVLGSSSRATVGSVRARAGTGQAPLSQFGFGGSVTGFPAIGNQTYNSGSVSLTRRFSRGLAFTSAYTFSKTIDDSTNELFTSRVNPRRPENLSNLRNERARSVFDIPHRFAASFNYEVPRFSDNRFIKAIVSGLSVNGIFQAQSGQPITPLSNTDSNLNGDTAGDRTILNPSGVRGTGSGVTAVALVNGVVTPVSLGSSSTVAYVVNNPNAQYIQAGPGARSTAGRNTLRSRGFNETDTVFLKNFRFAEERYNIQFGAEVLNLFNQRIRTIAGVGATSSAFANVNSLFFNDFSIGNFAGRTVQLRAKFIF